MAREGNSTMNLLDPLHGTGCDGTEYSACRPVVLDDPREPEQTIEVVYLEWCGSCGAADWELV